MIVPLNGPGDYVTAELVPWTQILFSLDKLLSCGHLLEQNKSYASHSCVLDTSLIFVKQKYCIYLSPRFEPVSKIVFYFYKLS